MPINWTVLTMFNCRGLSVQSLVSIQHLVGYIYEASRDQSRQHRLLDEIYSYTRSTQDLQDEQRRTRELLEELNYRMGSQCQISPNSENFPRQGAMSTDNRQGLLEAVESTDLNSTDLTTVQGAPRSDPYYSTVFKLDNSRFRKTACKPFCACPCHRRRRQRANGPWGRLALGYSSLPFLKSNCIQSCSSRTQFSATITYRFPAWLFQRVISLIFITSIFGDPWMGIKVRPTTNVFDIFRFASLGDVRGIKKLLASKSVHPSASFYGGWTALHVGCDHLI